MTTGTAPRAEAASRPGDLRVLVVEDDDDVQSLLASHLQRAGCRVTQAETGERGLDLARREPPDVVVIDVLLPGMDGREVIRELRADPRTRGCGIVVTSVLDREDLPSDADAVLAKPFSRLDVIRVLRAVREDRRGEP